MHYQILFPGVSRDGAGALRDVGLSDFTDGMRESIVKPTDGPAGLLISWPRQKDDAIGYFPDRQRWAPLLNDAGPQIGFWTDSPCTPGDLARPSLFTGYETPLADGHRWLVPTAVDLPATLRLVDRKWTKVRKPQFDAFWAASEAWFRRFMQQDLDLGQMAAAEAIDADVLLGEWVEFGVQALRQNYRVTSVIASELGLFDTVSLMRLTWSVVEGMAIREVTAQLAAEADRESAFEKKEAAPASASGA